MIIFIYCLLINGTYQCEEIDNLTQSECLEYKLNTPELYETWCKRETDDLEVK